MKREKTEKDDVMKISDQTTTVGSIRGREKSIFKNRINLTRLTVV